jgi:hypothetical protein
VTHEHNIATDCAALRADAHKILSEFIKWHYPQPLHHSQYVVIYGLTRDIMTKSKPELQQLIDDMTARNSIALYNKLKS